MFTGIIDHSGVITFFEGKRLGIKSQFTDLVLGESIAIDGICLTVTEIDNTNFYCDVSPETCRVTTANDFTINKKVNLERALQPTSRMGGHFVTGHIDQVCQLIERVKVDEFEEMRFAPIPESNHLLLTKKGSITVNGVSLTLNEVFKVPNTEHYGFKVMLIPHTLHLTNLNLLKEGDQVNLEFDIMARIILQQSSLYAGKNK